MIHKPAKQVVVNRIRKRILNKLLRMVNNKYLVKNFARMLYKKKMKINRLIQLNHKLVTKTNHLIKKNNIKLNLLAWTRILISLIQPENHLKMSLKMLRKSIQKFQIHKLIQITVIPQRASPLPPLPLNHSLTRNEKKVN